MAEIPLYPDFPKEEYDHRLRRARSLMEAQKLDALLVTQWANYVYYTGHRSPQKPGDKIRPYIVLLRRDGDPAIFVMPFELGHVKMTSWYQDVRTYELLKHNDVLETALREFNLVKSHIGCELGREQYLELSYNDFTDLKNRLPQAAFVDASQVFLSVRAVKSPAEIERCRGVMHITSQAMRRVFSEVKPGMTNLEVGRLVRRFVVEEGAERTVSLAVASGFDLSKGKVSVPVPRVLEVGDTLTIDTAAELQGYVSDVCWTGVIARASQQQRDMYKFAIDLNHKCYEALRPGNLCEDVVLTCRKELERLGRKLQGVGRIGHGVGREGTEYPSLAMGEKTPLEPGMVFACNPNFTTEFGFFNIEEDLAVTDKGSEILTGPLAPAELPVLG
jgi:Xaa-Pro aminopeptidase